MANILRTEGPEQKINQDANLEKTDFGVKVATAAVEGRHEEKHHHEKSVVEAREAETRELIEAAGGNAAGVLMRSNRQLTQKAKTGADVSDAWEDPTEVDQKKDDLDSALNKRLQRAKEGEDAELNSVEGDGVVDLNSIETANDLAQGIRHFSNFQVLEMSPEMYIVMGGLSESFDDYLASKGVTVQDPTGLSGKELQEIFALLTGKKRKALSEEEKEAELILSGAVAILALQKILEKLEELGLDPEEAMSLRGTLAKLIDEVKEEDSEYNSMYLLIKEETELSKLATEEMDAAA